MIVQTSGNEKRGYKLKARPKVVGEGKRMESGTSKQKRNNKSIHLS